MLRGRGIKIWGRLNILSKLNIKYKASVFGLSSIHGWFWINLYFKFERGAFSLMGSVDPESFDTLHSFSNAFEMPFVTPWFPEKKTGTVFFRINQFPSWNIVRHCDTVNIKLVITGLLWNPCFHDCLLSNTFIML